MKSLTKILLTGLVAIAPIGITAWFLYWLGVTAESLLKPIVEKTLGVTEYQFGMGIAAAVLFVFLVGILMRFWLIRVLFGWGERILERIPLVKTLYVSLRDLMSFFSTSNDEKKRLSQVVMVKVGGTDIRLIGLLTREDFSDLPPGMGSEETVGVYLPMSYQIGGFTTMVPRSAVEPIDMSMEDAMRFAVTAGMSGTTGGRASSPPSSSGPT